MRNIPFFITHNSGNPRIIGHEESMNKPCPAIDPPQSEYVVIYKFRRRKNKHFRNELPAWYSLATKWFQLSISMQLSEHPFYTGVWVVVKD